MKIDDAESPRSIYDPDPIPEEELWFVPDPDAPGYGAGEGWTLEPVRRPTSHHPELSAGAYLAAEALQSAGLARAAAQLGRLDEAVHRSGHGAIERLALIEAEAMLRAEGGRAGREEIARHLAQALPADRHRPDISRGAWAVRRLLQVPGRPAELRAFLGLHRVDGPTLPEVMQPRPVGVDFDFAAAAFHEGMRAMMTAHPITQGAWAFDLWSRVGLSAEGAVAEPAAAAARIAAEENRCLGFAPFTPSRGAWDRRGEAGERLARWIRATEEGARAALLELSRVEIWRSRALTAAAGVKGKSLARLIEVLAAHPMLSTETAGLLAELSRDSAERGLNRLHQMGLVRELTGQGRFRLWAV